MTPSEREALIEQYAAGYDEVVAALKGMPDKDQLAHPIPGKWSAREIVQHLADSESTSAIRLRKLLTEEHPVIQGYDQERYALLLRYNTREIAPALDLFRGARSTSLQLLRLMADEDWQRRGWHTEHGVYTPALWLQIYAAHAHNHAAQIRRLREVQAK